MTKLEKLKLELTTLGYQSTLHKSQEYDWLSCTDSQYQSEPIDGEVILNKIPPFMLLIIFEAGEYILINRNLQIPIKHRFKSYNQLLSYISKEFPIQ